MDRARAANPYSGETSSFAEIIDTRFTPTAPIDGENFIGETARVIEHVAVPLLRCVLRNEPVRLRWPNGLLYDADNQFQGVSKFYLTGAARLLSYGPYLPLPRGHWTIDFRLKFDPASSGLSFLIDLYTASTDQRLAIGVFRVPHGGEFSGALRAHLPQMIPNLEVRLFMMEGAIEGEMEFVEVRLSQDG